MSPRGTVDHVPLPLPQDDLKLLYLAAGSLMQPRNHKHQIKKLSGVVGIRRR